MSYLDLVESYPREYKVTLFEKVLMAAQRAKALHAGKLPLVVSYHKETYNALEEVREQAIHLAYRDEEGAMSDRDEDGDNT